VERNEITGDRLPSRFVVGDTGCLPSNLHRDRYWRRAVSSWKNIRYHAAGGQVAHFTEFGSTLMLAAER
jgi:hypothetical protein